MTDDLARLQAELAEARLWARALLTLAERDRQDPWEGGELAAGVVPGWLTVLGPAQEPRPPEPD
jgi:hypothetical protein